MKKSSKYIQATILNDTMRFYKLEDVADELVNLLHDIDDTVELYEIRENCIILRTKHTGDITEGKIAKLLVKAIVHLIDQSDEVVEYIDDNRDFTYDSSELTEEFFESIIDIIKTGRLLSIEIDI